MSQTSSTTPVPPKRRDPLLDLWRGLALVDMAWVHLAAYPIGMVALLAVWNGEHTRFAAGAFVLISGLSVARVFGPRLAGDHAEARSARHWLLRRAFTLAVLDRLVAVAFGLIERLLSVPATVSPAYPDLLDLLSFREPGVTGGLLFLYAVLLAATPWLNGALVRFGGLAVLAGSLGLFALAHAGDPGASGTTWPFPVAYWQPLFVTGYVVSHRLGALRDPSGQIARWWRVLVSLTFAVLFLLRNGGALGLSLASTPPALAFVKVPLSPAELAWYLTVTAFVLTWSAWLWEQAAWFRRSLGWLPLLGRQSLLVYVAHLFVQLALIEALTLLDPSAAVRALMPPLMALILVSVAAAGERWGRITASQGSAPARRRQLLPRPAVLGGTVIAGTFCAVMALQLLIGAPASWELASHPDPQQVVTSTEDGAGMGSPGGDVLDLLLSPWLLEPEIEGYPGYPMAPELLESEEVASET